jgi:hypothetical protein
VGQRVLVYSVNDLSHALPVAVRGMLYCRYATVFLTLRENGYSHLAVMTNIGPVNEVISGPEAKSKRTVNLTNNSVDQPIC